MNILWWLKRGLGWKGRRALSFEQLRSEYADLWRRMEVRPERVPTVNEIATGLISYKPRYQQLEQTTGVPWFVIAALHYREASGTFDRYLGNGEPLSRVTRRVPKGRGPFASFEEGTIDALKKVRLDKVTDWSFERACYACEKFNGFGYRRYGVNSPYLWSFSNLCSGGKFVRDGEFDESEVDDQCGTMPLIERILELDPSARFLQPH